MSFINRGSGGHEKSKARQEKAEVQISMQEAIKSYSRFINESRAIKELSSRDERPMVEGIAKILRGVRDERNRRELADSQVREFRRDGLRFDYAEFFRLCGLDK